MGMNILSWAALALLVIFAFNGLRRGLIMTVFSTFTMVVAIAVAVNISPYVRQTWQNTAFFDRVSQHVEKPLFGEDDDPEGGMDADQAAAIQGITAFRSYVARYLTCLMINALSFILVFAACIIVLRIVASCLNIISYLPVLHSMNKLGGLLMGLLNGLVILWIVCIAATIFSGTELGGYIYGQINGSMFLRLIYNHNYLMTIVASLKYLI